MDLAVKAAGDNLTITTKHPMLGDMAGTGTLKDDAITMNLTATGEMKMGIKFTGTVTGNKMAGTREMVMPSGGGMGKMTGGQAGAPAGGGQAAAPAGGQAGAPPAAGGQGSAPAAGGQGMPGGQGMMQGGQGGTPMANVSNAWTAEKK
jgi:hypothetical protein